MHIIHFTLGKANPNRMNGVGVSIHNFACAQAELGHDVRLWGLAQTHLEHDYPERPFLTELFKQPKWPFSIPKEVLKRLEEIPKDTVFHLHGGLLPLLWAFGDVLKKRGFRYYYTPHGAFMPGSFEKGRWRKILYTRFFETRLMRGADAVMVSGKGEKDFILKYFPDLNVAVIPNGYELLTSHEAIEQKETDPKDPIFCYCGRINRHHKGLDILIDGFGLYRKQGGTGKLLLIGGGPDMDFLKQKVRENAIEDFTEFTGPLYDIQKQARIKPCDVFVHTSRMEGFPSAVLEAAALGLPLLVSEATNMGDYVRQWQSGWVLERNEPECVAKNLLEIEKNKQNGHLTDFAQQALTMIQEVFLRKKVAEQVIDMYQQGHS